MSFLEASGTNRYFKHVFTLLLLFVSLRPLVTYIDEDENEILELSSNKTFLVVFKIPEECTAEEEWPHLLMERVIIS